MKVRFYRAKARAIHIFWLPTSRISTPTRFKKKLVNSKSAIIHPIYKHSFDKNNPFQMIYIWKMNKTDWLGCGETPKSAALAVK